MRTTSLNRLGRQSQSGRFALALTLGGVLALTAGCDRTATAGGQTIAVVNGEAITASDLTLELNNLPPAAREQSKAQVLEAMIDRRLLAEDAVEQKRDKVSAFVLEERRMRDVMLAQQTLSAFAQSSRQPVSVNEINDYLDRNPQVGSDRRILLVNQMQFATPPKPVLDAMRGAKSMAAIATLLQSRGIAAQRGRTQMDTAMMPEAELRRLAQSAPGEPLVVINGPATIVSEIVEQRRAPLSEADQQKVVRNRIEAERAQTSVKQQTDALRQAATISYSEEYQPKRAPAAR